MGMDQTILFPGPAPSWSAISALLARHGFPVQLRMIDGELSFPDEQPPEAWRELRLGTPLGMVTVRRGADRVTLVTWGNADAGARQAWNALAWAFAAAGAGQVQSEAGTHSADEFRRSADLPVRCVQAYNDERGIASIHLRGHPWNRTL